MFTMKSNRTKQKYDMMLGNKLPRGLGFGGGGGRKEGVLNRKLGRGLSQLNKTPTLFKTQRCEFCYPVQDKVP